MSDTLFPTRLRWSGGTGVARHDGVTLELHDPPPLVTRLTEIDFVPHVTCSVREGFGRPRDMTDDEIRNALALLQAMAAGARGAFESAPRAFMKEVPA
jgi:hypothetical protein